jgi:hypothetical protein
MNKILVLHQLAQTFAQFAMRSIQWKTTAPRNLRATFTRRNKRENEIPSAVDLDHHIDTKPSKYYPKYYFHILRCSSSASKPVRATSGTLPNLCDVFSALKFNFCVSFMQLLTKTIQRCSAASSASDLLRFVPFAVVFSDSNKYFRMSNITNRIKFGTARL